MQELPAALAALGAFPQFVTYRLVPSVKPGKTDKLPCNPRDGRVANAHDPAVWASFEDCAAAVRAGRGHGVGFVFTAADPFWFLDADNAFANGQWSALATDLCAQLGAAAVETSQSGTGLHFIGSGVVPDHACKNIPLGLELYTQERFVALTGTHARGDVRADLSAAMASLVARYFDPTAATAAHGPDDWTSEPVAEWDGPRDDEDLLRLALASGARNAAAAFGGDAVTFRDLWEGNVDALAKRWPESTRGAYDASSADAALAAHLAYWTGKDCERIRSLMYRSALVREKWEARGDYYLPRTILRACGISGDVAKGASQPLLPLPEPEAIIQAGMTTRADSTGYMGIDGQLAHFAGCVYVRADNRIYVPDGDLLDQARFDATFGGFEFVLDAVGKKMTAGAWEAFTRNRVYQAPSCHGLCFRPERPSGALLEEEGRRLLNTYVPISTVRVKGDPARFLDLLAKLLPVERDRRILLTYMASLVQNPGYKFQWWPVVQGVKGNGKSLLLRILSHAVGHRYTHLPNIAKMARQGSNFNGWIQGNLFLGLEEVKVTDRRDFLEEFKPYVTNDRLPLERKGVDEVTGDNRCNGLALTNHRDGVPIDDDERRYAIFYTAQQRADDLVRDGMDGAYFPDLYDWFKGQRAHAHLGANYGYAVVNDYLRTFACEAEFDPAGLCKRAPETSSTDAAKAASRGRAELEIVEAIESGRPGFAGGWVSSTAVDQLLERIRAAVPRSKRRELLQGLGFDYHPHLPDGRTNAVVQPDNGKPRLYVRRGHILCNLTNPADIAKRYTQDQSPGASADAQAAFGS